MKNFGFFKVCSSTPSLEVANVNYNSNEIEKILIEASKKDVSLIVFPELSITSSTACDLFFLDTLIKEAENELIRLSKLTKELNIATIIGVPLLINDSLYNCCAFLAEGEIKGIVPKTPSYKYSRWFKDGSLLNDCEISISSMKTKVGNDLIFNVDGVKVSIYPYPVFDNYDNSKLSSGCHILCFLESNEYIIGNENKIQNIIKTNSLLNKNSIIYSSAGVSESTTDSVNLGLSYIVQNGQILSKEKQNDFSSNLTLNDLDIELIKSEKKKSRFNVCCDKNKIIDVLDNHSNFSLTNKISKTPFIEDYKDDMKHLLDEIINIEVLSLAKRLKHTNIIHPIVGVSGGLDSTLALLVCVYCCDLLKIDRKNIIGITMPGFGTTSNTNNNANKLMNALGITQKEIDIKDSCTLHLKDIDANLNEKNVVFENAQARERSQILLDYANKINGLVVGTGDLSELALGFCTYSGDHISMYGVNSSLPKTIMREVIKNESLKLGEKVGKILLDILNTPISPELLPPDKSGNITQKTEKLLGDYILHDFYLYYFVKCGFSINKIKFLAYNAFSHDYKKSDIDSSLELFIKRFFSQQFKRSCSPDGPKIFDISLSPRDGFKMPSDASSYIFQNEMNSNSNS